MKLVKFCIVIADFYVCTISRKSVKIGSKFNNNIREENVVIPKEKKDIGCRANNKKKKKITRTNKDNK